MKSPVIIFFLLIFAVSQTGYFISYKCQQYIIRENVKDKIFSGSDDLPLSVFVEEKIQAKIIWEEKNKEFLLDGKMYDVLYVKTTNGKKIIYCYEDGVEEELDLAFTHLYEQRHKSDQGAHKRLPSLSISDFNIVQGIEYGLTGHLISTAQPNHNSSILIRNTDVNSPPPQAQSV